MWIGAGSSADTVRGGPGRDTLNTGGGDVVCVPHGQRDVVDCDAEQDAVAADRVDALARCERVTRARTLSRRPKAPERPTGDVT